MENEFRKKVQQTGLADGSKILLAVSGGIDSVVLLDLLVGISAEFFLQLQVLHLDHRIRSESKADAEFVSALCSKFDVPCHIEIVDIPAFASEHRLSLETAGREVRRDVLSRWAEEHACVRVVLAHHQDDQAETFLQRLLRGSGKSGLCGMAELDGLWWRPLLNFSRQQILAYAAERQLGWVEDASNTDTAFLRNRIRHCLIPNLREYNPQITQRLTSLSRQFQLEEDFWQNHLAQIWLTLLVSDTDGLRLDRKLLLECHPALQLRILREGLRRVRGDLRAIEAVHLDLLRQMLLGERSQAELDLPGCWAARRYEQLWLRKSSPHLEGFDLSLQIGEPLLLPDGRILLAELLNQSPKEGCSLAVFDPTCLQFPLRVRSLQPGDRFCPSGMMGQRKVKDFLIDLKLEKEVRLSLPVLLNQEDILWLVGLRRSGLASVAEGFQQRLVVRLLEGVDLPTKTL